MRTTLIKSKKIKLKMLTGFVLFGFGSNYSATFCVYLISSCEVNGLKNVTINEFVDSYIKATVLEGIYTETFLITTLTIEIYFSEFPKVTKYVQNLLVSFTKNAHLFFLWLL